MKEGWEIKKLKEIGVAQTGTTPKTSEKENFGDFIPFIKPADVDFSGNGDIRYDNDGLSEIGLKKGRKMERGSTLFIFCRRRQNNLAGTSCYPPWFLFHQPYSYVKNILSTVQYKAMAAIRMDNGITMRLR